MLEKFSYILRIRFQKRLEYIVIDEVTQVFSCPHEIVVKSIHRIYYVYSINIKNKINLIFANYIFLITINKAYFYRSAIIAINKSQTYKTSQGLIGTRTAKGYNYAQRKLIIFCYKKPFRIFTLIQYLNIKNSLM